MMIDGILKEFGELLGWTEAAFPFDGYLRADGTMMSWREDAEDAAVAWVARGGGHFRPVAKASAGEWPIWIDSGRWRAYVATDRGTRECGDGELLLAEAWEREIADALRARLARIRTGKIGPREAGAFCFYRVPDLSFDRR